MTFETRVVEPAELESWYRTGVRAFGGGGEPDFLVDLWCGLSDPARSFGVWDGDRLIGTAGAFPLRMSVPGGAVVPTAGVTMVTVQPTHRRQGVLTGMMRRQLDGLHEAGTEPLAVLTASEAAIYGRFGYGCSAWVSGVTVDTVRVGLTAPGLGDGVRLRLERAADCLAECEAVYARRVAGRPGMLERQPGWEHVPSMDSPEIRGGGSELLCVLAEIDGVVTGYARYATHNGWADGAAAGRVVLRDLEACDPRTRTALWRYLFGIDLMSSVEAGNLPVDDPLFSMVTDVRACRATVREGVFGRIVDVGGALSARTYGTGVDAVLEVSDAFCPWNAGRWRLSGGPEGAVCERTQAPADLALSARALASAYLGGVSLASLAAAGRVTELRPGAVAAASGAFASVVAPWLPHGF